ncbi:deoxyribodipyrimidine photolyase [Ideonella sp. 4Y16]|uniref:Deoxyribodipyrimidine photolyase n=1 Tax=Ideonella alba TaxID=2824118 RepID=A0A940YHA9_9BURK|nr:FAD-binding domain-containing protein [Ideonella alba]MBQ0929909.1 deoxyribodipyrimidine photolyase [Ideonella alba]MBQ0942142.1 deoxyribodipyrimidine photolyase [Ideonella alba]
MSLAEFLPTPEAARARLAAVRPADYARTRNALDGAVTRLSPYITHGLLSPPEVLAALAARHRLHLGHRFVMELGWRAWFRHLWQTRGDAILRSLHPGPLPDSAYSDVLPADIRQARSGVPVIDQAVRTLYASGYLHNHARMWLASYVVHLRKVHWRAGADWMLGHLLDGDLASNHLSWQWVAGTGSHKPYLFNADNVARYAPATWHSADSVLDTSYEALDALARRPHAVPMRPSLEGLDEPALTGLPPGATPARAQDVAGRDVWLVHPWALGDPPADLPPGHLCLGWWPADHHAAWPWSAARWAFVGTRLSALTCRQWHASTGQLAAALAGARSVQTLADPHADPWLPPLVRRRAAPALFPEPDRPCASFSAWWSRSTRGLRDLSELPALRGELIA